MALFQYQAVDESGDHVSGRIEAVDRRAAIAGLQERGRFVTNLVAAARLEAARDSWARSEQPISTEDSPQRDRKYISWLLHIVRHCKNRVSSKDVLAIFNQLSAALHAGLPLLQCLGVIRQQQHKAAVKALLAELEKSVSAGSSLSEAMAQHPQVFNSLSLAMVRVGETGGILEQTSQQLQQLLNREEQVKTNMKNASAYPLFVLGVGLISVVIVITWLLPKIVDTIAAGGAALPWPTKILLGLSGFVQGHGWLLLIAMVLGGYLGRRWTRSASGRIVWDTVKLKLPVLGGVLRSLAVGRFARTLSALTKGGVTILESLSVVRDALGNELLAREIDAVAQRTRAGESLAEPLADCGRFPPLLVQIVSVGEQTGKLDELLLSAADTFDAEADAAIARFVAILPAVLILLLACVIGFVVAATLLPIVVMELGVSGV